MRARRERGQIIVAFAFGLVGLLGVAALAIDVSFVYATRQMEKAAADAAALAGAQDLQQAGTRAVTPALQAKARQHALEDLAGRFEVPVPTGAGCDPASPIVDCALGPSPLLVSVSSPSKTTQDPRSVQVTVRNPHLELSFTRLFRQEPWDVNETSVAVVGYGARYAVVTLQPPNIRNNGTDQNLCFDLRVTGSTTRVIVIRGDIGTNTSATTSRQDGGLITLADGYAIEHYDDLAFGGCQWSTPGATWAQDVLGNPVGLYIGDAPLLEDPGYPYARFDTAEGQGHVWATQEEAAVSCEGQAGYPTDPATLRLLTVDGTVSPTCYQPGVYADNQAFSATPRQGQPDGTVYLLPGAYYFTSGLVQNSRLAGGMVGGEPGVVLVFPKGEAFTPNSGDLYLNSGPVGCTDAACRARPALDFASPSPSEVKTPDGMVITIEVERDESCYLGTVPRLCNDNQNAAVSIGGGGALRVAGVIYGPSDRVNVKGNAATTGYVGQIISWEITYSGGGTLEQEYPGEVGNGVLHLDRTCSGPGTPCTP